MNPTYKDKNNIKSQTLEYSPPALKFKKDIKIQEIDTGFISIDKIIGGLRTKSTFVVAGNGKSGKSSFLMNILNNRMKKGHKIGLINTELSNEDVFNRMTGIYYDKTTKDIEKQQDMVENWLELMESTFYYVGLEELNSHNFGLSFEKALKYAKKFSELGCRIIVFDNISTFSTQMISGKQGWQVIDDCLNKIVNFSKAYDVASLVVIHTTKGGTFKETPEGVRELLISGELDKLFTESISFIKKPTIDDIRGGVSLTQISGTILIWRPLQCFSDYNFSKQSQIILEQFRYCSDGAVKMDYLGDKKIFKEIPDEFESYISTYKDKG